MTATDERTRSGGSAGDEGRGRPPRLPEVFEASVDTRPEAIAVEVGEARLTYWELDRRANRLGHHLRGLGAGPGSRVAILLARSVHTYVALLAVAKTGAAFVPIDPESPAERVQYMVSDARVDLLVTADGLADLPDGTATRVLDLTVVAEEIEAEPARRLEPAGSGSRADDDPPAYVIYTSGSSGRPKGVEVATSSICNFLGVVPSVYDVQPDDRVYQGMTISFDFSIEEIWPTWAVGATVVAGPTDSRRLGADLADFLDERGITVLYCVPTLLATLPRDVPALRTVLVGGEACPAELVTRWARPGRRMLNTYGPTEATVTATWCELVPEKPVTIGRPLPTYTAELIDPDDDEFRPVPDGQVGEVALGGPGVARGYVGRPELTAQKFLDHPYRAGRVYRTGDLGRRVDGGEIEYLGRADDEVKVRGHRVDLGEIESVLLEDDGVAAAVVRLSKDTGELAAYAVPRSGAGHGDPDEITARTGERLRSALPDYMVPATLDLLDALPTQASGKVDRSALPEPCGRRLRSAGGPVVEAGDEDEARLREVWAESFGLAPEDLSVTADFFDDLGGHSLLAASTVSRMRARGWSRAAVRDLYAHPTVRDLAAVVEADPGTPAGDAVTEPAPVHPDRRVLGAGTAQAAFLYLFLLLVTVPASLVYTHNAGDITLIGLVELLVAALVTWLGMRWLLPLALARPLSRGITPGRYPLWGRVFLRLWALDLLLTLSPLPTLSGSPLLNPYLRAMGARVGRHAHIATSDLTLPALLDVGGSASIGYGATLRPWEVEHGELVVGAITVGDDGVVGTNAVLAPGTRVGAHAILAEQSALGSGERIPDGHAWSGSPAVPQDGIEPELAAVMGARRLPGWHPGSALAAGAGLIGLEAATIAMVLPSVALVWGVLLAAGMLAGLVAAVASGPVFVLTVCAVVALGRRSVLPSVPAGVHPVRSLLGVRKWIGDTLLELSLLYVNALYATLWTAPWLRLLGARIGRGVEVSTAAHLDPDLLTIGHDSFVADMASVGSASFANGRMLLGPTRIADRSFVGNAALLPARTDTGDDSLVGVLTVAPSGGVPAGSSWLGSPAIDLPRRQDSGAFDQFDTVRPTVRQSVRRLAVEFVRATLPGSALATALYLYLWGISLLAASAGLVATLLLAPLLAAVSGLGVVAYAAWTKRNVVGVYRPRVEPLWSGFVRRSEFATGLYEAGAVPASLTLLAGTPMLPPLLRMFGARIGKRCYVATTYLTEFDLVEIGDDVAVGKGVSLQTHLFEDRVMKMSHLRIGDGASVGTRSIVLYDAVVGERARLGPLSLLMKGEELPAGSVWNGIPAEPARAPETVGAVPA